MRPLRHARVLAFLALAACGSEEAMRRPQPAFTLTIEQRTAPEVFEREGPGRRSARETGGFWAVVQGLRRPESAAVRNLATGAEVTVALFAGRPAGGAAAELSVGAADALGIGEAPVQVRVTAVRDEPRVELP
jgi:hypothetical protein